MNAETNREEKNRGSADEDPLEVLMDHHADCVLVFGDVERLECLDRVRRVFGIVEAIERLEGYDTTARCALEVMEGVEPSPSTQENAGPSVEAPKRLVMTKDRFEGFDDAAWEGLVDRFLVWSLSKDRSRRSVSARDSLYFCVLAHALQTKDFELETACPSGRREGRLDVQYFAASFKYQTSRCMDEDEKQPGIQAVPGEVHWILGGRPEGWVAVRGAEWATVPRVSPRKWFDLATSLGEPETDPRAANLVLDRASFDPETGVARLLFVSGDEERTKLVPACGGSVDLALLMLRRCLRLEFGVRFGDVEEFEDEKGATRTGERGDADRSEAKRDPCLRRTYLSGRVDSLRSFREGYLSDATVVLEGVEVRVHLAWMRRVSALFAEADPRLRRFEVATRAGEGEAWLGKHVATFFDWLYGIEELEDIVTPQRYAYCVFGARLRLVPSQFSRLSRAKTTAAVSCGIQRVAHTMSVPSRTTSTFLDWNLIERTSCILWRRSMNRRLRRPDDASYLAEQSEDVFHLSCRDGRFAPWKEFCGFAGLAWSDEELRRWTPCWLRCDAKDPSGVTLGYETGETERYEFSPGLPGFVDLEWVAIRRALRERGIEIRD